MNSEELNRLQALCDSATPGPWQKGSLENGDHKTMLLSVFCDDVLGSRVAECGCAGAIIINDEAANAAFIAEARTALPALIAEVQKLQAFKNYVHHRLDVAGIDKHEEQNALNGCRIGARLSDLIYNDDVRLLSPPSTPTV